MFESVLIANRGEIAVRVIRACRALGLRTIAVHSESDAESLHVRLADEVVSLGGTTAVDSYLNVGKIMDAMATSGAGALHPGYGFLSENVELSRAVTEAGRAFVGPPPAAVEMMGSKVTARAHAIAAGVPVVPGTARPVVSAEQVIAFGEEHGFPLAIKAAYGGGGRGMRVVFRPEDAADALFAAQQEASTAFGNDEVYLEKFLEQPRHVEIQLIADQHGNAVWLGDRDCSVQRRNQKLIEEAPASIGKDLRVAMGEAAVAIAHEVGYTNAGTIEYLVQDDKFWFLEMNTRLQVEHPVTEMTSGIDIVAEQLRVAAGHPLSVLQDDLVASGHAIEMRINAENPDDGLFLPDPGKILELQPPTRASVRWDGGYESDDKVSSAFDSLLGKLIAWGPDRDAAIDNAKWALSALRIEGLATTAPAHALILDHPDFRADTHSTRWLENNVEFPTAFPQYWRSGIPDPRNQVQVDGRTVIVPRPQCEIPRQGDPAKSTAINFDAGRSDDAASSDGHLKSPMQGTVVNVRAATGDKVTKGQVICVIEAMKMANELKSPMDGTVTELNVEVGSLVAAGDAVAMVEAEGEE